MGWEKRRRGGYYYTRSRKVRGRVVREYVGGGMAGKLAAAMDAQKQAEREAQAEAWRAERTRQEAADATLLELCEIAEAAASGTLILAGYHRHHRGEWRRRREQGDRTDG